ncbi:uncharacterized protein LOC113328268 [Papaver somniferum]|uniref:uncharacterized protein LOC113328268 n=1 Tax=Papaver somniferum TaxID=3469 RepID=UPI000E6FF4F8|nr:uncharacterized protein LOC113328268 [Papaver somniferum]
MEWLDKFQDWGYKVGLRVVSDHSPLLGGCANIPKPKNVPLRFQEIWLEHPYFLKLAENSWAIHISGDPTFVFIHKLKRLKQLLKEWNWSVFGNVQTKIKEAEENVRTKMLISYSDPHNINALGELVQAQNEYNSREVQYSTMMRQKSRIKWVKEGSANTQFFHTNIKVSHSQNLITEMEDENGNIISDQEQIENLLVNYFEKKFHHQEAIVNDSLLAVIPKLITEDD